MRFATGFVILAQCWTLAWAQSSPDPAALLARQQQEVARHRSYQFTQDMTMNIGMPGMTMPPVTYSTVMQGSGSGMRIEVKIPGMGSLVTISDGKQTWMYMPLTNSYTHTDDSGSAADMASIGMGAMPDTAEMTKNAKVTGSEVLDVDGEQHECWVIESRTDKLGTAQPGGTMTDVVYTSWIDKQSGMQLKMKFTGKAAASAAPAMETGMTMVIHAIKFDEELPESLFVFTPPAGAKETKELFPGMDALTGAAAGAKAPVAETAKAPATAEPSATAEPVPNEAQAYIPFLHSTHEVKPVYPSEARAQKLQGFVDVLITVDSTGAVTSAEALTGPDVLRGPAMDAVKQWTFRPVIRNGRAVTAYTQAMLSFPPDGDFEPGRTPDINIADEMKEQQRLQELQTKFPRSPQQVLADSEDQAQGLTGYERFDALSDLAKKALDAGDLVKAKSYATELLEKIPQMRDALPGVDPTGTATFDANTLLGLVALRQGSVSQARQYLLESAKTPVVREFGPFGPDFTLARELLAKGEQDAVLEFLTGCKQIWQEGGAQLDSMIESVRKNGTF